MSSGACYGACYGACCFAEIFVRGSEMSRVSCVVCGVAVPGTSTSAAVLLAAGVSASMSMLQTATQQMQQAGSAPPSAGSSSAPQAAGHNHNAPQMQVGLCLFFLFFGDMIILFFMLHGMCCA